MYGEITRRYKVAVTPDSQSDPGTTFQAYWVGDAPGQVAVLARNDRTGQQVWSGTYGYPGDYWYREFHRKDPVSGLQYWRMAARAWTSATNRCISRPRHSNGSSTTPGIFRR